MSTELVPFPRDACPACGARPLAHHAEAQSALVRHGGYGATRVRVWRMCWRTVRCGWSLMVRESEVRPL